MNAMQEFAERENAAAQKSWSVGNFPEMHRRVGGVMKGIDTAMDIISECRATYGITMEEMQGPSKKQPIAMIRQECMAEIRRTAKMSLPDIGRLFNRHHTTVLHAIKQSDKRAAQ